jgi:nucleoid-associated protein YgaU
MGKSRYRNSLLVRDDDGDWISPIMPLVDVRERPSDILHTVQQGDRLDTLAYRYLHDPHLWWVIAEYNHIMWFQDINVGQVLRVPSYETFYLELMRG